jgi:hypothetical protein
LFGVDEKTFAHTVQVKVACSASVVPSPQKNKGPQVVVQGNQVNFVVELLTGKLFLLSVKGSLTGKLFLAQFCPNKYPGVKIGPARWGVGSLIFLICI